MKGFRARKNPAAVATANGAQDNFANSVLHNTAAVDVQMMRLFPASQRAHATYILDKSTHQRRVHYKTYCTAKPVETAESNVMPIQRAAQ